MKCHSLIVIPARRASTRLPEKLLLAETGRPLLAHTIDRAIDAVAALGDAPLDPQSRIWVVADDEALLRVAEACGVGGVMTGHCESGTERIWSALPSLPDAEVVLNLQADEPEMPADWIVDCIRGFSESDPPDIVTVAVPIRADDPSLNDPNFVKVVVNHRGRAMYFSRATIPALRKGGVLPNPAALGHLGIYAFSTKFLKRYPDFPQSPLEKCECLEQLRFLQGGSSIKVLVKEDAHFRGIDTPEDYRAFVDRKRGMAR
ncbi:MAG: 3-deoxy-manno-octulosonate cytidylyltransferase [Planctomycetota bacterium]